MYIAHGQATAGSDALGRPPEPTSRCKCKSFSRGQRPRYVKMYALNHRPPGALPPFYTFALTARCGLTALPRVSLTSFALPWAMNSPSFGGRGMAFSHPAPQTSLQSASQSASIHDTNTKSVVPTRKIFKAQLHDVHNSIGR